MNSGELKRAKRDVRRHVLAARDAIAEDERARLALAVSDRFLALPEIGSARSVMVFWSFGSEVPTGPLIEELVSRGVGVALPRIVDGELEPRSYQPGDPLTETAFGAFEPANAQVVPAREVDVIATPAVAFDREGRRVGYGGGFYDRFFVRAGSEAFRAGIGFSLQVLPGGQALPAGGFDLRVDAIVTEAETIRCRRER
jgi:5-formyltetrahydrofolate cyclo-ligase